MPLPIPGRTVEALRRSTAFISNGKSQGAGAGSGIVLPNDQVVTNAHVIADGHLSVESWEGKLTTANLLRIDRTRDLALLETKGLNAPAASFADSASIRAGTPVIAVGNPLGFKGALSTGTVHAFSSAGWGSRWICADVRLAPGNSGGPLADWLGRVVGINTMVMSGGLALAVPSRAVQIFLAGIKRRTLGVTLRPVNLLRNSPKTGAVPSAPERFASFSPGWWRISAPFELPGPQFGLLILEVTAGGPAAAASLLPGDVLTGANGKPFQSLDDLETILEESGDTLLTIEFRRGGNKERRVTVSLPASSTTNPTTAAA